MTYSNKLVTKIGSGVLLTRLLYGHCVEVDFDCERAASAHWKGAVRSSQMCTVKSSLALDALEWSRVVHIAQVVNQHFQ